MKIMTQLGEVHFGGASTDTDKYLDIWHCMSPEDRGEAAVNRAKADIAHGARRSLSNDAPSVENSAEVRKMFFDKPMRNNLEDMVRAAADNGLFVRVMVGKMPTAEELE